MLLYFKLLSLNTFRLQGSYIINYKHLASKHDILEFRIIPFGKVLHLQAFPKRNSNVAS